jgi:two-component system, chemotaxis family, chemotaxis protein CheY
LARVLVIEDELVLGQIMTDLLTDEGHEPRLARNGREGLHSLRTWKPDVILLDLMMPVMDGWAFRAAQRRLSPDLAGVPVIVLSGARELRTTAEMLGAAVTIAKPFDLDAVAAAVSAVSRRLDP